MRYELKSITVWPFFKVAFFFNLIVGFIGGACYALFMVPMMAIMSNMPQFQAVDLPMEDFPIGMMLIILPIVFALFGAVFWTIFGLIAVLAYNLIGRVVGGLEFDLTQIQPVAPVAPTLYAQTAAVTPTVAPVPPPAPPIAPPALPTAPPTPDAEVSKNVPPAPDPDSPTTKPE